MSALTAGSPVPAHQVWLAHLRREADRIRVDLTPEGWIALAEEAQGHQLRGLTYRLLADGPYAQQVLPEVLERLRAVYLDTAMRNALLFRHTSRLVAALSDQGIPVILLKGLHLARYVYPEPALRNMADVDLMVPRDRLVEAERAFLDLGFGPLPRPDLAEFCTWSNHLAKLEKPGAPVIELHWGIERPTSPFRIDLGGLWERSRPTALERVPVRLLAPEDLLLHLALHCSYHHEFDRSALKGLVDVDVVVSHHGSAIDWTTVAGRANEWGASGFVYTTFRLAREILATPFPPSLLANLRHEPADEEVVDTAIRYTLSPQPGVPTPYLDLARSKNLRERARLLLENAFLPRATMERIYRLRPGTPIVFGYYVGRLLGLGVRRSRMVLSALLRSGEVQPALDRARDRLRIDDWVKGRPGSAESPPEVARQ